MTKTSILNVQGIEIALTTINEEDFICITDIVKAKGGDARAADIIKNWIRNRSTIEFLGTWETLYNPNFKVVEFDHFRKEAGLPTFTMSVSNWIEKTGAIAEIDSKKHNLQQCMDIVLGAMAFVLNKKHLETAPGTNERGKRTIAKEQLFNHIIELIKESNGCEVFCICETTPSKSPKDYWITPYRHWKFLPAEFRDQKCL